MAKGYATFKMKDRTEYCSENKLANHAAVAI